MKNLLLISILSFSLCELHAQGDTKLLFDQPATHFTSAVPLGNGRLGAMMYGNPVKERVVLNEISMWSGGVHESDRKDAATYLPKIQQLLLEGKNKEAQQLLQQHFVAAGKGTGHGNGKTVPFGCYQTFGDLLLEWKDTSRYDSYSRSLDLERATGTTRWKRNGVNFSEEMWVSAPDQVVVVKLSADKKNKLSFSVTLDRKENAKVAVKGNAIELQGQLTGVDDKPGIRFAGVLKVIPQGGKWKVNGNRIVVEDAGSCLLLFSAATDMNWPDIAHRGPDPLATVADIIQKATVKQEAKILRSHINDYQSYFQRSRIYFTAPASDSLATMTTVDRLKRYKKGGSDPLMAALYFNYGRYLLISSSRPGGLPANLQGLWAEEYQTPWNGDYHLNINVQMNYWPAEVTNLSDCHEPMFRFIQSLVEPGKVTARAYYNAPGWVAHVVVNPWGFTSPGEGASWGSTLTGGAWLCNHIREHFRFTKDTAFLRQYYPALKEAARFFSAILIRDPATGWFVTAPSNSPENTYITRDGFKGNTCMGPTMDMQIGRELLQMAAASAEILGLDKPLQNEWKNISSKLAPNQISASTGGIQEWLEDYKEAEPQHRHISQLYGLHPFDEITPWGTPELAAAAMKTLERRGFAATGWSRGWKLNFWARAGRGEESLRILKGLLEPVAMQNEYGLSNGPGTYPNLFCAHPPFQIDGNFGGTAGIAEMLLQSHGKEEVIRFLPALPLSPDWASGTVKGMRARGSFTVGMNWKDHRIVRAELVADKNGYCQILLPEGFTVRDAKGRVIVRKQIEAMPGCFRFETCAGEQYIISKS